MAVLAFLVKMGLRPVALGEGGRGLERESCTEPCERKASKSVKGGKKAFRTWEGSSGADSQAPQSGPA